MPFILCIFLSLLLSGTTNAMESNERNVFPEKPVPGLYRCTQNGTFEKIPSHMYDMADDEGAIAQNEPVKNKSLFDVVWIDLVSCAVPLVAVNLGIVLSSDRHRIDTVFAICLSGIVFAAERITLSNKALKNRTEYHRKNKAHAMYAFGAGIVLGITGSTGNNTSQEHKHGRVRVKNDVGYPYSPNNNK
jgi:hypothetical protein